MEQRIEHRGLSSKSGIFFPTNTRVTHYESIQQRINFNRVVTANHLSRFARPADLDEFVRGVYAL